MIRSRWISFNMLLGLCAGLLAFHSNVGQSAAACQADEDSANSFAEVILSGNVQTGLVAIGGETTGTVMRVGGIGWELEWPEERAEEWQQLAERVNESEVLVRGALRRVKGVERGERWIVTVSDFQPSGGDVGNSIYVRLQGKLNDQVVAIGGETTGTTLDLGSFVWELELGRDLDLNRAAEKLHDQTAFCWGMLEVKAGTEIRRRFIVNVRDLGAAVDPQMQAALSGVVVAADGVQAFAGRTLEIQLFEYDPRLADVGAKEIDRVVIENFAHDPEQTQTTEFNLGIGFVPRLDRSYYITVFVLDGQTRTHIGERDAENGLAKVLPRGQMDRVRMVIRQVR